MKILTGFLARSRHFLLDLFVQFVSETTRHNPIGGQPSTHAIGSCSSLRFVSAASFIAVEVERFIEREREREAGKEKKYIYITAQSRRKEGFVSCESVAHRATVSENLFGHDDWFARFYAQILDWNVCRHRLI